MTWAYDAATETWMCGTEQRGCGVFHEVADLNVKEGWYYNVVIAGGIVSDGPFPCRERAQEEAENEFARLEEVIS